MKLLALIGDIRGCKGLLKGERRERMNHPDVHFYKWETESDYTKKTGVYPAILFSIVDSDDIIIRLEDALQESKLTGKPFFAEILTEGPLWDCLIAGTKHVISEKLKDFLISKSQNDLDYLPISLKNENGDLRREKYYAIIFKHVLPAIKESNEWDYTLLASTHHKLLIARNPNEEPYKGRLYLSDTPLINSELAEELIEKGFTGLGFSNPFSSKKPGKVKVKERIFPEELTIKDYLSANPLLFIEDLLSKPLGIQEGWQKLLSECAKKVPSDIWEELDKICDIKSDSKRHLEWIENLLDNNPPPKDLKAFWIGIFDRAGDDPASVPTCYASGSKKFNEEEKYDFDWACNPDWFPENRYYDSAVLRNMAKLKGDNADENLNTQLLYFLVLGYTAILFRSSFSQLSASSLSKLGKKQRPIAVGFDDGDAIFIGRISGSGFKKDKV